jgi:CHAT domain-containing protein/tetratricopeptide (TPR) repeat protein
MKRLLPLAVVVVLIVGAPAPHAQSDAAALAREGYALLDKSQLAEARKRFDAAIPLAKAQGNKAAEADAQRGLGTVLYQQGRWNDAPAPLQAAIALYAELGDRIGEARALDQLGSAGAMTRRPDADASYRRAIEIFAAAGDRVEQARTIRNRSHLQEVPLSEKVPMLEQAFALAEGDARLQGLILHSLGGLDQTRGRYASAIAYFERARPMLASAGTPREQARLAASLAASHHMHGQSLRAIEIYLQAMTLLEQIGDVPAQAQTLGTLADSYVVTGQLQLSLAARERALELSRKTGSPGMIATAQGTLGQAYVALGQYEKAITVMEEALGDDRFPDVTTGFYRNLARAYAGVGRIDDALRLATRGVELAREKQRTQIEMGSLQVRSMIYEQSGKVDLALDDARAGLDALERLRTNLAPSDYLKGGFADTFQSLFAQTISLLDKMGRTSEAVVVAEQARARAFLDLLASREVGEAPVSESRAAVAPAIAAVPESSLTFRGGAPAVGGTRSAIASAASAPVPTATTILTAASRLGSTLVTFWVGDEATFVWVTAADGRVRSHRIAVTRAHLQRLVRRTWSLGAAALASRGAIGDAEPAVPEPAPAPVDRALTYVTMRGGERLTPTGLESSAYRELYDLLIEPIRSSLPKSSDRLLTIVPHGPLFELSFAALTDSRGRYLLEDYRLHYAPSAATLAFTARHARPTTSSSRYLFVANPLTAPNVAAQPLAALPGAEREVKAVSQLFGSRRTTTLMGRAATESAIKNAIGDYRVVHFATHGLVSSDNPFDSYLALAPGAGDGRLTAGEIYELQLSADLVVLSACRAAGGRISGDGIVGLTRAFFSAGTPSILAAMWDMADESAEQLLPRFYAEWQKSQDKGRALRSAQLSMLRDLRAGRISVDTPFGAMPLPPHPALWANLVLIGEPR